MTGEMQNECRQPKSFPLTVNFASDSDLAECFAGAGEKSRRLLTTFIQSLSFSNSICLLFIINFLNNLSSFYLNARYHLFPQPFPPSQHHFEPRTTSTDTTQKPLLNLIHHNISPYFKMSLQSYPWPLCFPYWRDIADDESPEYVKEEVEEEGVEEKEQGWRRICCPECWGNSGGCEEQEEDGDDLYLPYPDPWFEMSWPWGFWV
jgi:hypothetical protein